MGEQDDATATDWPFNPDERAQLAAEILAGRAAEDAKNRAAAVLTSVNQLWPRLTEMASERACAGFVIGVAHGEIIEAGDRVPVWPWWVDLDPPQNAPEGVWLHKWPRNRELPVDDLPDELIAAFAGMALFWDRDRQEWRAPLPEPMGEEEAKEAAEYVRSIWFKPRGKGQWPWKLPPGVLALNVGRAVEMGEATPQQARWVATAIEGCLTVPATSVAASMRGASRSTPPPPARLPMMWDWRIYLRDHTTRGEMRTKDHSGSVRDFVNHNAALPWPYWADEKVAVWRLLHHTADLLFTANKERWGDSKAHLDVELPPNEHWFILELLLSEASRQWVVLDFDQPARHLSSSGVIPSRNPSGLRGRTEGIGVALLWGVLQGWAHLRQCAACGKWVVRIGPRPLRTCNGTCRVASHRRETEQNRARQ